MSLDRNVIPLPPNATRLEGAYVDSGTKLLGVALPIEWLWDAWRCPSAFLPHLAYALSVDLWDDGWSEIDQRRAIADSPAYHRRKGTRAAVEQALDMIGRPYTLTEWWQRVPEARRGTARVFVEVATIGEAAAIIPRARRLVYAAKPKSRAVAIDAGLIVPGEIVVAAVHTQHWTITIAAHVPTIPDTEGIVSISTAVGLRWTLTVLGEGLSFPPAATADSTTITADSTVITADNMGGSGL